MLCSTDTWNTPSSIASDSCPANVMVSRPVVSELMSRPVAGVRAKNRPGTLSRYPADPRGHSVVPSSYCPATRRGSNSALPTRPPSSRMVASSTSTRSGAARVWTPNGRAGHCEEVDLDAVAVELYGLTPDEFTAARNQLAKNVDGAAAAAIRALRKPTLAAWLANLLVRTDPARPDETSRRAQHAQEDRQAGSTSRPVRR